MNAAARGLVALWPLFAAAVPAQEARTVQVVVTSVAGRSVYFDRGRTDGLAIGTRVRLFAPGGTLDLEVLAVTATSARAELQPGWLSPPVGTRGEAMVRAPAAAPPGDAPQRPQNPEHPPWTRREGQRDPQDPLLAPAFGMPAADRPMQIDGRLFALLQWNRDEAPGRESDYYLGRFGADLQLRNPFGAGGRLQFDGEFDRRELDLPNGPDSDDGEVRVDLLSYAVGDEQYSPLRLELGRFYSDAIPELGLVDGVECIAQFADGWRLGGGGGSYPVPFPSRDSGDDLGVHAFVEYSEPTERRWYWVAAAQKTWHRGAPDRDLALGRLQFDPAGPLWTFATAKVDFYTDKDDLKPAAELTEAMVQVRADGSAVGGGTMLSHFRWPQLLREEYRNLPAELVDDGRVERAGGDLWWRPWSDLRLAARGDAWWDQDGDGVAWDLSTDWSDCLGSGVNLYVSVFESAGSSYGGPGGRVRLRRQCGPAWLSAGYQRMEYSASALVGGAQRFVRESIDAAVDVTFGDVDVSLTGETWFGDQEDAFAVTLFVQYRF